MRRTLLLLKAQLINTYSINEMLVSGSKNRKSTLTMAFAIIVMGIFVSLYNAITAVSLVKMGVADIIPPYMASATSFAILLLAVFKVNGSFFGSRDHEMLMSLPIKESEIFAVRFLNLYLMNLALSLVFIIPSGIVWVLNIPNGLFILPILIISTLILPIIPMCIASLFGMAIIVASSKFKRNGFVSLILSFAVIGAIIYIALNASAGSQQNIDELSTMLAQSVYKMYPLGVMFSSSFILGQVAGILMYITLSVVVLLIFIRLIAPHYDYLNQLVTAYTKASHGSNAKIGVNSPFMALYKKEFKRFLSSNLYIMNSSIGTFGLIVFGISCFIFDINTIGSFIGMPGLADILKQNAPFIISAFLVLSCTTAASISLEGNNLWILQYTPVSKKTIINSKIAVNLTTHIIAILISVSALIWKVGFGTIDTVLLLTLPLCYSLFTAVFGIFLNDKFPNFNWTNEMQVIKQSAPVMLSMIIVMACVGLPFLSLMFVPAMYHQLVIGVVCVILLSVTGLLYRGLTKQSVLSY